MRLVFTLLIAMLLISVSACSENDTEYNATRNQEQKIIQEMRRIEQDHIQREEQRALTRALTRRLEKLSNE